MKYSLRVISAFNTVPYVIISWKKKKKKQGEGTKRSEKHGFKKKALKRLWKNQNIGMKIIIFATEEGVK